jgi:hypothetical protein
MRTRKRKGGAGLVGANQDPIPFYYDMDKKKKLTAKALGDPFIIAGHVVKFDKTNKTLKEVPVDDATLRERLETYDDQEEEKFFNDLANPRTKKLKNSRNYALNAANATRKAAWTASGKVGNAARAAATAAKPRVLAAGKGVASVVLNPLTSTGKGAMGLGQGGHIVGKHVIKGTGNVLSKWTGIRSTYGKLADAIDILIGQAEKIGIDQQRVNNTKEENKKLREFINSVYFTRSLRTDEAKPLMEAYESAKTLQDAIFVKIKDLVPDSGDTTIQNAKTKLDKLVDLQEIEYANDARYNVATEKFTNTSASINVFEKKIELMKDSSMIDAYEKLKKLIEAAVVPAAG